jgi:predicted component of type VI protein secretion system
MPLTLALRARGPDTPPVPPLRLDGRGAVIGRSADADWRLPDPRSLVSSRHCEVAHRDGVYVLVDTSTNGTFVNGRRLAGPHRLANGDTIGIGDFEVAVLLDGGGAARSPQAGWDRPAPAVRPAGATAIPSAVASTSAVTPPAGAFAAFLHAAGIDRAQLRGDEATTLAAAGALLRRFVAAFRAMDDDRTRARTEIGAPPAPASGSGNPISAARSPEQALSLLLSPPQPGVVPGPRAVDDVTQALELHRRAVLMAMQAALGKAIETVGPAAIRARAPVPGLLARLLPGGGDAALWRAYERSFDPAADTGFVATFAEEYREAYTKLVAPPPA